MARCHIFGKSVQHKQKQCINNANQIVNLVWNQIFNKVGFVQGWAALESKWQEVSDLLLSCICLGFLPLVTLSIIIFTCCSTDSRRIYWGGKLFKTIEMLNLFECFCRPGWLSWQWVGWCWWKSAGWTEDRIRRGWTRPPGVTILLMYVILYLYLSNYFPKEWKVNVLCQIDHHTNWESEFSLSLIFSQ